MLEQEWITTSPLTIETNNRIIYKALLARGVEQKLLELYNCGELSGTIHTCIGQEFTGAVVSEFVKEGDAIFSNHRCHGHFLSITQDITGLIAEIYGKQLGVCGGKGGSQHIYKNGFYSNGIQGGIVPIAAGLAFGKKIKKNKNISIVFIGDGTLGEGALYETLNIVSKWNLPIVIVLENNLYAQSTKQSEVMAGSICARAEAFSIKTAQANTWDFSNLYQVAEKVINYSRSSSYPSFLQIDTYRLNAHSKGDDQRDVEEIDYYQSIDPLNRLLAANPEYKQLETDISHLISNATIEAKNSKDAAHFSPILTPLRWNHYKITAARKDIRMGNALNETFLELMAKNDKIYFIGEDVKSPYGGAFKISRSLSEKFPDRVLNTPISESAIIGLASGLALEGYLPIVEIMFGDFITLAMDQIINHATKFRYMYNDQVRVPLIIRTPMGGGRGYGPTHSQTLDRHLIGTPGLRVMAINNLVHPKLLYETVINSSEDPTLIIENKVQYTNTLQEEPPEGFRYKFISSPYPMIVVEPESSTIDLTIVAYGGLTSIVTSVLAELFLEYEIIVQLISPLQIYPFEVTACHELFKDSSYIVLIEEGQNFANFSSEFIAQYYTLFPDSKIKAVRIGPEMTPIPSSKNLEYEVLINKEKIIDKILSLY